MILIKESDEFLGLGYAVLLMVISLYNIIIFFGHDKHHKKNYGVKKDIDYKKEILKL